MTRLTRSDAPVEHVASTPIAVPTGEPGPLVTAPAGPVRGVWRRIVCREIGRASCRERV